MLWICNQFIYVFPTGGGHSSPRCCTVCCGDTASVGWLFPVDWISDPHSEWSYPPWNLLPMGPLSGGYTVIHPLDPIYSPCRVTTNKILWSGKGTLNPICFLSFSLFLPPPLPYNTLKCPTLRLGTYSSALARVRFIQRCEMANKTRIHKY